MLNLYDFSGPQGPFYGPRLGTCALSQYLPTFVGLRHPYLVIKIFVGTPNTLLCRGI